MALAELGWGGRCFSPPSSPSLLSVITSSSVPGVSRVGSVVLSFRGLGVGCLLGSGRILVEHRHAVVSVDSALTARVRITALPFLLLGGLDVLFKLFVAYPNLYNNRKSKRAFHFGGISLVANVRKAPEAVSGPC